MMMSEGAGELNSTVAGGGACSLDRRAAGRGRMVPIILSATELEATGARMQVGGLRVVDRAIRLLARLRDAHVVIAADGSVPVPRRLPPNMERREIDGDADRQHRATSRRARSRGDGRGGRQRLAAAGAVRQGDARGGRGLAPGRRRDGLSRRPTGDGRDRRSPAEPEDRLAPHPALAGSSARRARAADPDRRVRRRLRRAHGRGRGLDERPHRLRDPGGLRHPRRLRGRARARAPAPDGASAPGSTRSSATS